MGNHRERHGSVRTRVLEGVDSMDWPDRKLTNIAQMIQHCSSRRGLVQEDEENDDVVVVDALYCIPIRLLLGVLLFFDSIDSSLLEYYLIRIKTIAYDVPTVTHWELTCPDSLVESF